MELSSEIVAQFAKATKDVGGKTERTLYGTIRVENEIAYVELDGSNVLTPISTTVDVSDGDRVMVMVKNHTAVITGNLSAPAAGTNTITKIVTETQNGYAKKTEDGVVYGDHTNDTNTPVLIHGQSLHYYIKSAMAVYKPYYEHGDSLDAEWYGAGYISDSGTMVYFSIPLSKPVIGTVTPIISSVNGLTIRQNGVALEYQQPTYSASLSCDGGIVNVIATLGSTNAVTDAPCGVTASVNILFSNDI